MSVFHVRSHSLRCATLLCAFIASPFAAANDFYLGFGLGGGDVEASPAEFSDSPDVIDETAGDNVAASEVFAGLQFESGLLLEIARDDYDTLSIPFGTLFTGSVDYSATRLSVGIAPEPSGRFGFVGKLGLSFWDLELTESPFLNPGSEDRSSRNGEALYLQIGGEFHVTPRFRIGTSFDFTDTDAGNAQALKFNLRYVFKD